MVLANADILKQVLTVLFAKFVIVKADVADGIEVRVNVKTVFHY